jgi:hypothetical protein
VRFERRDRIVRCIFALVCGFAACDYAGFQLLRGQTPATLDHPVYNTPAEQVGKLVCPGGFPSDLTVTNCEYTERQRVQQWINTSFNDEAMLGAVMYGAGAQIIKSPSEWGRTWEGYGQRMGVRYTQGAARGTAEFIVGNILHDDPRHLSYKDDPYTHYGDKIDTCHTGVFTIHPYPFAPPSQWARIGHAFRDSVTVLTSDKCGKGRRNPAFARFVGIAAGAYGGYAWYPGPENTLAQAGLRAAGSYGSTLVGSFYTEYSQEISMLLSRILGKKTVAP